MNNIWTKIKENWFLFFLNFVGMTIILFLGDYCARILNKVSTDKRKVDTVYIEKKEVTDTILRNIAIQVKEINNKITPKKVYIQKRRNLCDTLKIDAAITLKNK